MVERLGKSLVEFSLAVLRALARTISHAYSSGSAISVIRMGTRLAVVERLGRTWSVLGDGAARTHEDHLPCLFVRFDKWVDRFMKQTH